MRPGLMSLNMPCGRAEMSKKRDSLSRQCTVAVYALGHLMPSTRRAYCPLAKGEIGQASHCPAHRHDTHTPGAENLGRQLDAAPHLQTALLRILPARIVGATMLAPAGEITDSPPRGPAIFSACRDGRLHVLEETSLAWPALRNNFPSAKWQREFLHRICWPCKISGGRKGGITRS